MRKIIKIAISIFLLIAVVIVISIFYLPVNRVRIDSELVMLGDLNNDNKWDKLDLNQLEELLNNPFMKSKLQLFKTDINRNGSIDDEDIFFLRHICQYQNPYRAQERANNFILPKPREFYQYLPKYEYIQPPLIDINYNVILSSPFAFLSELKEHQPISPYQSELIKEIYSEAVRFAFAYELRESGLMGIERKYLTGKVEACEMLFYAKNYYKLLLNLIGLVEDAETLSTSRQSEFIKKILYFRDHLKELLISKEYEHFKQGEKTYLDVFKEIESHLKTDLNMSIKLNDLSSPRDFTNLENYLDRAEWQAYKSKTTNDDFKELVLFAQYDRRYLRAVSRTSPRLEDVQLENHNLPMILLFREALRIKKNKKAALGLLDESVRIPMGWVKSIPNNLLPSSIALENFLLPGNKEDGSDKTRHWSVFGGVSIYKNPEESLILSLQRENLDLKDSNYSIEAMSEFIRDTIANINGIYYVVSINPRLLYEIRQ